MNTPFQRSRKAATLSALFLLMLASACEGPQGDPGPVGPAGPQGAQGPQGATGAANVRYSDWVNVTFAGSGSTYTGNLTAAPLTQDVLDKADIRVYWKDGSRVITLPYAQILGGTTYTVHQRFYVGRIELVSSYALGSQSMRYVVIPGGSALRMALNLDDYEAVKKAFNLPD